MYRIKKSMILPGFTLALAAALAGCDQSPTANTVAPVSTVQLYEPGSVSTNSIELLSGSTIEVRWPAEGLPAESSLFYRDLAVGADDAVSADIATGQTTWTVPASLAADTDYDFRIYNTNGEEVLLQSQVFNVVFDSADTSSNGPGDATSCGVDADCDDGLFCTGVEICTNGMCMPGPDACTTGQLCDEDTDTCLDRTCETSADCFSGEVCQDGVCVVDDGIDDDLAGHAFDPDTNGLIDLAVPVALGRQILLDPQVDAGTDGVALPAASCACTWTVDPSTNGLFDDPGACRTTFTPMVAGTATLIFARQCGSDLTVLRQSITAAACTADDECGADGQCVDGACAPPGPSIEVLQETPSIPYVVRLDMRLKDADGEVIASGVTRDNFRVYENAAPIDLTETNQLVTPAPNLPMRVVLVLDYTRSMQQANAVDAMIEAAKTFLSAAHFTATHQIGIIEFHDRGDEGEGFSIAAPLTIADAAGRAALTAAVPGAQALEGGLSRAWDAVDLAMGMLTTEERPIGEVQAVVFLTDGRDTTSEADAESIATAAADADIRLYPIGFGDVSDTEASLKSMAQNTAGRYFAAADASALNDVFGRIALDLRGQWNLTYITTRNSGLVDLRVVFDWNDRSATYTTSFDAGQIAGDVYTGLISVLDRTYDPASDYTSFLMKAEYMPRGINALSFTFAHSEVIFLPQAEGGLLDPDVWTMTSTGDGVYILSATSSLELGAFGNIGVALIPGDVPVLQVTHNDAIYASLVQPKSIAFQGDLWAEPYTLTVNVTPDGYGAVAVEPEKAGYGHGEVVALTAVPIDGVFNSWTGSMTGTTTKIYVVMDDDKTVTANFVEPPAP